MWKVPEIMATIGPTLEKPEDLCRAIEAGARWFRLPCGYRQRPHLENARAIRAAAEQTGQPVQLLMDLPSSRPRTGKMAELRLDIGDRVVFWDPESDPTPPAEAKPSPVPLPGLSSLLEKLGQGQRMWFCDGRLEFRVDELSGRHVLAHLDRGSVTLKSSNAICLPDSSSPYVIVTAEDRALLNSFARAGLIPDWIALSLICSPQDMSDGRREVREQLGADVRMMAKIETAEALQETEAIIAQSDGVMVARGDLGPAVEFVRLPEAQEQIVAAARRLGKVSVVATQVLETFAETGIPQRAELSDLSLAARQRPDAVMLGKETVYSPRPIESIRLARDVLSYETCRLEVAAVRLPPALSAAIGTPRVVGIEGPNGSGKSLLCQKLSQRLRATSLRGVPLEWEAPEMKLRMIRDADWLASAMYFLSGVMESSRQLRKDGGKLAIMDRSVWSTLAVQYAHDPQRLAPLMSLLSVAGDRIKAPDLTIVLEASPATCRGRIAGKPALEQQYDSAEPAAEDFQSRQRDFYRWLAQQWPGVVFLDTEGCDGQAVCDKAESLIRGWMQ